MSADQKKNKDMPVPARIIAAAAGLVLLPLGLFVLLAARPLNWKIGLGAVISAGIGVDLLHGAVRGRWPVAVFFWLVP
jgi:hypothetical protein